MFSDESHFQLCSDDDRRPVWRNPGQPGPLWSSLEHTYSTTVRRRHSENCFATVPFAVPWPYFSGDKVRPYTEKVTMNCLTACQTLPWPNISPDFSSIEHVWDRMGRRLHLPGNGDVLGRNWRKLVKKYRRRTPGCFITLLHGVTACIQARGV
ncbi:transposable element Tc1 transposase [Trichonephila clavipes]|nr:transposable element Tc1 transposase [Trichonephila clavipes]